MPKHDFSALQSHYPEIIAQMQPVFTSHQFILALAQQHQVEYIHALADYVDSVHVETPAPFQFVHSKLATMLHQFPQLVQFVRDDAPSINIFGEDNQCAEWRKV